LSLFLDAHLDLAYLAVRGRNMLGALDVAAAPSPPAAVTLPSLAEGGVRVALATIFTEAIAPERVNGKPGPEQYPAGNIDRASSVGRAQMEVYLTWRDRGAIRIDLRDLLRSDAGVGEIQGGMGVSEVRPPALATLLARARPAAPLHIGILVENADPIRSPEELPWWTERGVVAIGMAWARPGRYAAGNATPREQDSGITELGRALVGAMDEARIAHDVSHLSDRSMDALFALTNRPVIASHSNCRALLNDPENQRHLRDDSIREIVRRGGVIGLNLCRNFIAPKPYASTDPRPSIAQTLAHVEHICAIAGHTRAVGLGSDMDGGFGATDLPDGINRPLDLDLLLEGLSERGWSDQDIAGFAHGNFARFFAGLWSRAGR
jgi:membrane dipeptidase